MLKYYYRWRNVEKWICFLVREFWLFIEGCEKKKIKLVDYYGDMVNDTTSYVKEK